MSVGSVGSAENGARGLRAIAPHLTALALLLVFSSAVTVWNVGRQQPGIDYYQFWIVGRAAAAGEVGDLYSAAECARLGEAGWQAAQADAAQRGASPSSPTRRLRAAHERRVLDTYSSPWLYTVLGALTTGDYERDHDLFQGASLALYLLAIAILARLSGNSMVGALLWMGALLHWFNPLFDDTVVANVNRLQLFLIAAFLWLSIRSERVNGKFSHALAGLLLGSAIVFKPNLAYAALVLFLGWAIDRQWRRLAFTGAGLALGAMASVLLSAAYWGTFAPWGNWVGTFQKLLEPGSPSAGPAEDGNYSLVRLVHDRGGPWISTPFAIVLLAATAAALWATRNRAPRENELSTARRDVLLVGMGLAIGLLTSGLAWQHYFVATIPLAVILLGPEEGRSRGLVRVLALLAVALVSLRAVALTFDLHGGKDGAPVIAGGTLLLFVLGLWDCFVPRQEPAVRR